MPEEIRQAESSISIGMGLLRGYEFSRQFAMGVADYCLERAIPLYHVGISNMPDVSQWLVDRLPPVDGLIFFLNQQTQIDHLSQMGLPVINYSASLPPDQLHTVIVDNREIGRLAAEHLLAQGLTTFAYVATHQYFSTERAAGFIEAVTAAGYACESIQMGDPQAFNRFINWLKSHPKTVGLMASSDDTAHRLMPLLQQANLKIPQDVAVIGVDNDELFCSSVKPHLTSVDIQSRHWGYRAGQQMHKLIRGHPIPQITLTQPAGVIPRASTAAIISNDALVEAALQFIHQSKHQPITVDDVAAAVGIGRRTLERRFKQASTRSIADWIRHVNVTHAQRLLLDTNLPINRIAIAASFIGERQMRLAFANTVGQPPSSFRQRKISQPDH